jgi:tripartite-type tricarboxylate transporter receptor subunit TctC
VLLLALAAGPVAAQYPNKPKRLIVPRAGLFAPAKTSKDVVDRLARELAVVLARPEVREQLDRYAFEGRSSMPEGLAAFLEDQIDVWGRTARGIGMAQE